MGVEKSQEIVDCYFNDAITLINKLKINHELILEVLEKLKRRVK